jgi:hypothetical protein
MAASPSTYQRMSAADSARHSSMGWAGSARASAERSENSRFSLARSRRASKASPRARQALSSMMAPSIASPAGKATSRRRFMIPLPC